MTETLSLAPRKGETVLWMRCRKGGNRAVTPIPVQVIGRTVTGSFRIERTRRNRTIRETVAAKNIRPIE